MDYVSSKKAAKIYGVCQDTLRRWSKDGKINFTTTKGGHRRYQTPQTEKEGRKQIIYARVSSKKQESDLNRQIKFLKKQYPTHEVITDIASGINYTRTGFSSILEQVFRGNVQEVVVSSRDRLTRFGIDLIENIFKFFNTKLIIGNSSAELESPQEELAEDLLSIVTVFTAKYHGSRRYTENSKGRKKV